MNNILIGLARAAAAVVVGLGLGSWAVGAEAVKVGDKAPAFSLKGSDGKTYSLDEFKGKKAIVLAWFPKAFTGGCTKECKSFRESSTDMKKMGVAYFTASVDTSDYNKKFAESLDLDYPILSDPGKSVAEAYGVVHPGRAVPERWTFYIDKEGVVRAIDKGVQKRTVEAGPDVIAKVKELGLGGN